MVHHRRNQHHSGKKLNQERIQTTLILITQQFKHGSMYDYFNIPVREGITFLNKQQHTLK